MQWYRKYILPAREAPRALWITGGSSGIGRATALLFAALGHDVAISGRDLTALEAVRQAAHTAELPGAILPLEANVTDPTALQRAVALTLAQFKRLDVLIANAGIGQRGSLVDSPWEELETVLRTNLDGVIHSVRAAVPALRASGGGHIVLISSVLGPVPAPFAATYSASKAAVDALGRALHSELKPDRIAVSVLWVGQTRTAFAERRLGQPGRVASRWPTMTPEQVAGGIARALERKPRAMTLRPIDGAFVWAGRTFPGLMDRLLGRIYGGR